MSKKNLKIGNEVNMLSNLKTKSCTAKKCDFTCTVWGSPWCSECALYRYKKRVS